MASTIFEELIVDAAVSDFLRRHDLEAEFRKLCELVQGCFPGLVGLEVTLQDDPDEDGRAQAVLCAKLPERYPEHELQTARRCYYERLIRELPLAHCPLFALVLGFVPE